MPARAGLPSRGYVCLFALALIAPGADALIAASAATAQGTRCGVYDYKLNETYAYYASGLVLRTDCATFEQLADGWYSALENGDIPDRVFQGQHGEFGHGVRIFGFTCRWRRYGSDIGTARCDAPGKQVVTWGHYRGTVGAAPSPSYSRIEPPTLHRPQAEQFLNDELATRYGNAYFYANRSLACAPHSRTRLTCRASWVAGDSEYTANAHVVLRRGGDGLYRKRYVASVRHVNAYCASVAPGPGCSSTTTIRG